MISSLKSISSLSRTSSTMALAAALASVSETCLDRCQSTDRELPRYVEKALREYLICEVLGHGFVRIRCYDCGKEERPPAFSCKGRGFCPSCTGRRIKSPIEGPYSP